MFNTAFFNFYVFNLLIVLHETFDFYLQNSEVLNIHNDIVIDNDIIQYQQYVVYICIYIEYVGICIYMYIYVSDNIVQIQSIINTLHNFLELQHIFYISQNLGDILKLLHIYILSCSLLQMAPSRALSKKKKSLMQQLECYFCVFFFFGNPAFTCSGSA